MGDVALTIPVLLAVVEKYPEVNLTFVTRPFFASFIPKHPQINVVSIDLNNYKGVFGMRKLAKELAKNYTFETVIDLHEVLRTKLITGFLKLKGKQIFTIDKGRKEKKKVISHQSDKQLPHTTKRYLDVFSKAGFSTKISEGPWLFPTESISEFLTKNMLDSKNEKWIGIAPFAAHEEKMWGMQNVENLIVELINKDYKVFLFGGGKKEIDALKIVSEKYKNSFLVAGEITFGQELSLIKMLDCMVAMDSSNMHISTLVGIKTISIWGATTPLAGFYPLNNQNYMIQVPETDKKKLTLSTYGKKASTNNYIWQENISVLDVINKIEND